MSSVKQRECKDSTKEFLRSCITKRNNRLALFNFMINFPIEVQLFMLINLIEACETMEEVQDYVDVARFNMVDWETFSAIPDIVEKAKKFLENGEVTLQL